MILEEFIKKSPKAELHLHIEGTLEPELMFSLAKRNNIKIPFKNVNDVKKAYNFSNLDSFLKIYYEGAKVLIKEQDFFDLTWAYILKCREDNIVHTEIFFDPQTHTDRGIDFDTVINGIFNALKKGEKEFGLSFKIIMCFLRHLNEDECFKILDKALAHKDKIYGVGLDSSEKGNPPKKFERLFKKALENEKKLVKDGEAIRGKASKKRAANTKRQLALEKRSNAFVKKAIKEEAALRKKAEAEANALATKRRARRQKLGSTASSAIIGGAFPLLFGQTGAAAVGGGLGGAAGGLIGGQFGFALSILGTAIGSTIDKVDKFNISVAQLNGQLNSLGFESSFSAKEINNIGKALKITGEEALGVAANLARFGKERAQILATTIGGDTGGLFAIANAL